MPSPSTTIFVSPLLRIGTFRCPIEYPHFRDTGPIVSGHLIVFPRTPVRIYHPGVPPIIADPNLVMFYNLYQSDKRDPLSAQGDRCEWFAFTAAPGILTKMADPIISLAAPALTVALWFIPALIIRCCMNKRRRPAYAKTLVSAWLVAVIAMGMGRLSC